MAPSAVAAVSLSLIHILQSVYPFLRISMFFLFSKAFRTDKRGKLIQSISQSVSYTHLDVYKRQVYTLSDPREVILKRFAQALAEEKGMTEECELYNRVENIAGKLIMEHRKLFKNVCANVDFYSG